MRAGAGGRAQKAARHAFVRHQLFTFMGLQRPKPDAVTWVFIKSYLEIKKKRNMCNFNGIGRRSCRLRRRFNLLHFYQLHGAPTLIDHM